MAFNSDKSEIAFFDVETSVPTRPRQGFAILEFGAILVCPKKLIELQHYSTLVRPFDLSLISNLSVRCNGITKDAVISAPTFAEIADQVYDILHGRIWAGHNILRFDCYRIREAFAEINRPAPEPKGTIDSLALLTQRFGRRAGDMKMASLATYFGLGQQIHRSLDDVRMNLEVLKYCATVLFLESSLPDILTENSWISPNVTTRSRSNGKASPEGMNLDESKPSSSGKVVNSMNSSLSNDVNGALHPIFQFVSRNEGDPDVSEPVNATGDPYDMSRMSQEMGRDDLPSDDSSEGEASGSTSPASSVSAISEGSVGCTDFLEPGEISLPSLSAILVPFYRGTRKIRILHNGTALQVCCKRLKVRFGISSKYADSAGRPRLSIVVDATPNLCQILDTADGLAQKLSADSDSSSEWKPVVIRKPGYMNFPTIRLNLPTVPEGNMVRWITDIYHKESSTTQRLVSSRFDVIELESLFARGSFVDAYFCLDTYDYQQSAGIRLVANKLVVHSN